MRSDFRKRLERLEVQAQARKGGAPNLGACLSREEWRCALAAVDPEPDVAFAAITAEAVGVFVLVIGAGNGCRTFGELVASPAPAMHFWAARMAMWAIQTEGGRIHPDDTTPESYAAAIDSLFPVEGATPAGLAMRQALLDEGSKWAGGAPREIHLMAERSSPIALELSRDDLNL